MKSDMHLLEIKNLNVSFGRGDDKTEAVKNLNLTLAAGETIGIVGESGSGKSVTSLAIMGLLPETAQIEGSIIFRSKNNEIELLGLTNAQFQNIRGKRIAMIFQEPMTSLNPVHTCGVQVAEAIKTHTSCTSSEAKLRVLELFEQVNLPRPEALYDSYPHQLSGGQKQRVMIAMALSCNPDLIIADEPTTALDVTVQKKILTILKDLCAQNNTGLIFITHDLGVVAEIADRVCVMYRGNVMEKGAVSEIFQNPTHAYTQALLACRPRLDSNPVRLPVVSDFLNPDGKTATKTIDTELTPHDESLIEVKNLNVWFPDRRNWKGKPITFVQAVNNVSFTVRKGETLGLVGESGCGKTTLGRAILKLVPTQSGEVIYDGREILSLSQREFKPMRKKMQLIFQDPFASLNPRFTVGEALIEPMQVHGIMNSNAERRNRIGQMLDYVGLPKSAVRKYPHEFSGGQRQRICIARALVIEPEFIVCDESVSALDVSVQAQVLNLLNDLKQEFGLTYIFISHDLSVVKYMSNRLLVMRRGIIEEQGDAGQIYSNPQSAYTRELIDAIPVL